MALPMFAVLLLSTSLWQESVVPPGARTPLPHPAANAPLATVNDNLRPAGARVGATLTLALDVVEAAYQPEGEHDPVVRTLPAGSPQRATGPGLKSILRCPEAPACLYSLLIILNTWPTLCLAGSTR